MRPMEVQCMFTGVVAGHGTMSIQAVNTPVSLCGMEEAPLEIMHMDENGAVKFPGKYLADILKYALLLRQQDGKRQAEMRKTSVTVKIAAIMKGIYQ